MRVPLLLQTARRAGRSGIARCGAAAGLRRPDWWLGTILTRDKILSSQALTEGPPESWGGHWQSTP